MFKKRRVLMIMVLVLSLSCCFQVNSYTMARVYNSTFMTITSSDNALIATPDNIVLDISKDIFNTNIITMKDEIEPGISNIETDIKKEVVTKLISNNFYITNNMNDCIDIKVFIDKRFKDNIDNSIKVDFNRKNSMNNNIVIKPGEKFDILFDVENNIESKNLDILISAKWSGGTAEIRKNIEVNVLTNITNSEIIKDMRTPIKIEDINSDINNFGEEELQNINAEGFQSENKELNMDTNLPEVSNKTTQGIMESPHDIDILQVENNEIL